jgi:hypothetical protein
MASALDSISVRTVLGGPDDRGGTNPTVQAKDTRQATATRIQGSMGEKLMNTNPGPPSSLVGDIGKQIDLRA